MLIFTMAYNALMKHNSVIFAEHNYRTLALLTQTQLR